MKKTDPFEDALARVGLEAEKKDVTPVTQMIASGLGGVAGSVASGAAGFGPVGRAVGSLFGAVAGHIAVTYRIHRKAPAPEPQAAWSDRR